MKTYSFFLFIFITTFFSIKGVAQIIDENPDEEISKFLVIRTFQSKNLPTAMVVRINKTILMAGSKQNQYSLILSNLKNGDVDARTFELVVDTFQDGEKYKIDVQLINSNRGKIFRRVRKGEIEKANLVFAIEKALALLFDFKETVLKSPKKRSIRNERTAEIDFKERIMALKEGVQDEIKVQKKQREASKSLENQLKNQADSNSEESKINQYYTLGGYYKQSVVDSTDIILIKNNFDYLVLDLKVNRDYLSFYELIAELKYGKPISSSDQALPDYIYGAARLGFFLPRPWFNISGGLSYESFGFVNLTEVGQGLTAANLKVFWSDIDARFIYPLDHFDILIFAKFSNSLGFSTDYPTLSENATLEGDRVNYGIGFEKIIQKVNFFLKFETINFNGSGVRDVLIKESNSTLHFQYIF